MFTVSGLVTVIVQMLKGIAKDNKPLKLLIVAIVGVGITTLYKVSEGTLVDSNRATIILEGIFEGLAASGIYGWYNTISKDGEASKGEEANPFGLQINE